MKKTKLFLLVSLVMALMFGACTSQSASGGQAGFPEGSAAAAQVAQLAARPVSPVAGGSARPVVVGKSLVMAGNPQAAAAGYRILLEGGNAFDAAVAVAGVQGVIEAGMTNILGGDAEIIVWSAKDQKAVVYNGTGWAPKAATVDFYLEQGGIPSGNPLAIQLPGAWSGWMLMLKDYGTLPLETILAPVIEISGAYPVDRYSEMALTGMLSPMANESFKKIYRKADGTFAKKDEIVGNPDYAATLQTLVTASKRGRTVQEGYGLAEDYFYRGPIAEKIVAWSKASGGLFELADFADFRAERQEPWGTTYGGYEILVCPPNSQGPLLLQALNMAETFDLKAMGHNSAEYLDTLVQILNLALQDRNDFYGDMRFVDVPKSLIGKDYARQRVKDITPGKAMDAIPQGYDALGKDTTYMYIMDQYGNVVSSTHSLCTIFGSQQVPDGTGIIMNNRMRYFTLDEDMPNVLEPRKRTMQTITPILGLKNGKPAFVSGLPGADTQCQAIFQTVLAYIDFGMNPQEACEIARVVTGAPAGLMSPNPMPKTIGLDLGVGPEAVAKLEGFGYKIITGGSLQLNTGSGLGFAVIRDDGYKMGGSDPRGTTQVIGW